MRMCVLVGPWVQCGYELQFGIVHLIRAKVSLHMECKFHTLIQLSYVTIVI